MAKQLIQVIIQGATVVGRAFSQALKQEIRYSQEAAKRSGGGEQGRKSAQSDLYHGMTLQEAKQILNISDEEDTETTQKHYEHLFKMNEKKGGGSFYLQSKVYRAKERLDMELLERQGETTRPPSPSGDETKTKSGTDS